MKTPDTLSQLLPQALPADKKAFVDLRNTGSLAHYLRQVYHQFMYANNFGLAIDDEDNGSEGKAVFLQNLFVTPQLGKDHLLPEQLIRAEIDNKLPSRQTIIESLQQHARLFILGDPGCGKSTLINWLMLAFSNSGENVTKLALGNCVPFALILRELNLSKARNWDDVWQIYLKSNTKLTLALPKDPEALEQVFNSGQALFLLDGLDEITHPDLRRRLGLAVLEAMQRYPRCRFVISSRLVGFNQQHWFGLESTASEADEHLRMAKSVDTELLPTLYLSPFDQQQAERFSHNWYKQYVPDSSQHAGQVRGLVERIGHNDGLGRLARIPVLLNMICFIHARRGRLPDGRAELYQSIAKTYLTGLDRARNLQFLGQEFNFDYFDLSEWLGTLALRMQNQRSEDDTAILISEGEVRTFIVEKLEEKGFGAAEAKADSVFILKYLSQRSGMFIPRGQNEAGQEQYAFSHLSFMEYFAAAELKVRLQFGDAKEFTELAKKIQQPWWKECCVLLFEQLENTRLAEQMFRRLFVDTPLSQDIKAAPAWAVLAEVIMDSGVRLSSKLRQEWIKKSWGFYLQYPHFYRHDYPSESFVSLNVALWTEQFEAWEHFSQVAEAMDLTQLSLRGCKNLNSLERIAELKGLQWIDLGNTGMTDVSPLAACSALKMLFLNHTGVTDISPLIACSALKQLNLSNTGVTDVSPLAACSALIYLHLSNTGVTDASPLAACSALNILFLDSTSVTDVSPLATCTALEMLNLSNTGVTDVSPLAACSTLKLVDLSNTGVTDVSMLQREGLIIDGMKEE
ncbi:leucine-rich repeat domain-containing protein [Candidatus Venteria ishoeyi]|uniref:Internalin-A n=1 Tax=Candidatus Venteria ishoeyi TaxID=1899563 RepID=A0A1H6FEU6_9GAMM|nr:leucine-rich repeat domain-containing protein [Candidatus Venteria ishoeyi]SEH07555.1 Internalin-A precursor [Candidatus Venteria ishoeyi]